MRDDSKGATGTHPISDLEEFVSVSAVDPGAQLLAWYEANRRELPWRGRTDPYEIWVSEIMLQQTRSETVEHYYQRFLDSFPNLETLARASEDEVLAAWSGLGYYRRARQLRLAAGEFGQTCHDRFADLEFEGVRIAMLHGDDQQRLRETVECQEYNLVCFGHTHRMEQRQEGVTTLLNPGALYRATPHSLAIVRLPEIHVRFIELDT